jgi:hypothetical protein
VELAQLKGGGRENQQDHSHRGSCHPGRQHPGRGHYHGSDGQLGAAPEGRRGGPGEIARLRKMLDKLES